VQHAPQDSSWSSGRQDHSAIQQPARFFKDEPDDAPEHAAPPLSAAQPLTCIQECNDQAPFPLESTAQQAGGIPAAVHHEATSAFTASFAHPSLAHAPSFAHPSSFARAPSFALASSGQPSAGFLASSTQGFIASFGQEDFASFGEEPIGAFTPPWFTTEDLSFLAVPTDVREESVLATYAALSTYREEILATYPSWGVTGGVPLPESECPSYREESMREETMRSPNLSLSLDMEEESLRHALRRTSFTGPPDSWWPFEPLHDVGFC